MSSYIADSDGSKFRNLGPINPWPEILTVNSMGLAMGLRIGMSRPMTLRSSVDTSSTCTGAPGSAMISTVLQQYSGCSSCVSLGHVKVTLPEYTPDSLGHTI